MEKKIEKCEICGKPRSSYPNWLIGKGHEYHVGCLSDAFDTLKEISQEREKLLDQCVALLSIVRPDIHKQALKKSGISEETFNSLLNKETDKKE